VDDLDAIQGRLSNSSLGPYKKAILFVDNAGADIILGMIPLARELVQRGTQVILSSNSTPALNDITHPELILVMEQVAAVDGVLSRGLADGRMKLVASGNGCPLIDLTKISAELAREAEGADLIILEGMGRALQSNCYACFKCDAMKLAMVKDAHVAHKLGCPLMACYCRFEKYLG